jgi:hypothetical protein
MPSTLNTERVCSSETLVSTYKSTRRHNPEHNTDIFNLGRQFCCEVQAYHWARTPARKENAVTSKYDT